MMKKEMFRVALYARVSTDMQVEKFSIAAQLNEMKEYAASQNWQVVAEYVDPGQSGRTLNRPGLQNLLKVLDNPPWDIVMVHELSRLSRSIYDTFRLFDLFGNAKIGFYSVKDPNFDFSSAQGRFFLSVISATNQYYIDLLREHTAKGKRERARSGLYNSSTLAYGYEHHGDSRTPPRIHTKEADAVRLAFESYATSNCSFQQVADKLNDAGHRTRAGRLFSKDTIDDMLRNRFYLGKTVYGMRRTDHETEEFEGQHEPIITEELYNVCDQVRHLRRQKSRSYQSSFKVYLMNAVSRCSICNQALRAQSTASGRYYRDASRMRGIANCPNSQKGVRADIVEAQIEDIFRHLSLPDDWQEEVEQLLDRKDEVDVLNNRRARLLAEQVRLRQLFQGGYFGDDMDTFKAESDRLQREINALPVTDLDSIEAAADTLEQLADVWDEADMETKRDLVRLVLNQVEIDVGQKRIVSVTPNAAFFPLFRQSDHLFEIETGRFVPVWPPALSGNSPMPVLPTVQDMPSSENAISWPHIFNLPTLPKNKRISPILSKFLKSRRQDILPVQKIIDVINPNYPRLQLDVRKWPGINFQQVTLPKEQTPSFDLPDQSVSLIHTPFVLQGNLHKADWIAEVRRLLDPGGWWVLIDLLPTVMPGHWIYRYFPGISSVEAETYQSPSELYANLQGQDYTLKMRQLAYYQPVSLAAAQQIVQQRQIYPIFDRLTDLAYQAGLDRLEDDCQQLGEDHLIPSHFCYAEIVARLAKP